MYDRWTKILKSTIFDPSQKGQHVWNLLSYHGQNPELEDVWWMSPTYKYSARYPLKSLHTVHNPFVCKWTLIRRNPRISICLWKVSLEEVTCYRKSHKKGEQVILEFIYHKKKDKFMEIKHPPNYIRERRPIRMKILNLTSALSNSPGVGLSTI